MIEIQLKIGSNYLFEILASIMQFVTCDDKLGFGTRILSSQFESSVPSNTQERNWYGLRHTTLVERIYADWTNFLCVIFCIENEYEFEEVLW